MIRSLSIILALVAFACDMESNNPKDIETITNMSKARAKAFNQGDAATIASYFSKDAVLMAPGKPPLIGPAEVENYYQSIFNQYETKLNSYYNEVEVSGDLAYGRGTAEVTLIPKDKDTSFSSVSKYLNILKKQPDGTWKTTHDIWNGNQ